MKKLDETQYNFLREYWCGGIPLLGNGDEPFRYSTSDDEHKHLLSRRAIATLDEVLHSIYINIIEKLNVEDIYEEVYLRDWVERSATYEEYLTNLQKDIDEGFIDNNLIESE